MRRWWSAAAPSGRLVAERPELWIAGALAWCASVGWVPLVAAVARLPSVAELTFFGAGIVTSGAWPWNAIALATAAIMIVLLAVALAASGDAAVVALLERRALTRDDAGRMLAVRLASAVPAALAFLALLVALVAVAPREFTAPDPGGGPVVGTALRVWPAVVVLALAAGVGAVCAATAGRLALARRGTAQAALRAAGRVLWRLGAASAAAAVVSVGSQLVFLLLAGLLLHVLWAPIGSQLGIGGQFDLAAALLLVGFVAIWLCIVLAGGALHAWSATTWSRLLASDPRSLHSAED
jgi:hypothetical protein